METQRRIEKELALARQARADGLEGKARVCARRAVGVALRDYFSERQTRLANLTVVDLIQAYGEQPNINQYLREICTHLLTRIYRDWETLAPLMDSNLIFMGPGSPSYTVRQLQGSLAWDLIRARHRLGAALALASAATVAMGAWAIPVYEIFKVGEDPHWKPGLDLLGDFGLHCVVVPHWNNTEGGQDVDTGRCFIG